jgi:hypothetical protein
MTSYTRKLEELKHKKNPLAKELRKHKPKIIPDKRKELDDSWDFDEWSEDA